MVKKDNRYNSFNTISKHEAALLQCMENKAVFSLSMMEKLLSWNHARVSNTLTSLKNKQIVIAVKKDNYTLKNKIPENIFAIATAVTAPSYISFWTALSYYGYTEQQVYAVQVVSTKQYPVITFEKWRIETVSVLPKFFFGYQKLQNFSIVEKEKLLIDCLLKIESAGGIEEYKKCLVYAWKEIDEKKLLEYLIKLGNKSLIARLGYLLELLQLRNKHEKQFIAYLPKNYVKLHPQKKDTNDYDWKWRVIIND